MSGWQRRDRRRGRTPISAKPAGADETGAFVPDKGWTNYGPARVSAAGRLSLGWLTTVWAGELPAAWSGIAIDGWLRLAPATSADGGLVSTCWDDRGHHRYPHVALRRLLAARQALPSLATGDGFVVVRRATRALLWIAEIDPEEIRPRRVTP